MIVLLLLVQFGAGVSVETSACGFEVQVRANKESVQDSWGATTDDTIACSVTTYDRAVLEYAGKKDREFSALCAERLLEWAQRCQLLDEGASGLMNRLGDYYEAEGAYDKAEAMWNSVLSFSESDPHAIARAPAMPSILYAKLGKLAFTKGDLGVAEAYYFEALTVLSESDQSDSFLSIVPLLSLGKIRMELEDYPGAEGYFGRAVHASKSAFGSETEMLADALQNYGAALSAQGYEARALQAREQADLIRVTIERDNRLE